MQVNHVVNGVDLDRLTGTIDAVTAQPALAQFEFRGHNQWVDGGHTRTTIQGFYGVGQEDVTREKAFVLDVDEPSILLGQNLAPNAGEYLLHAIAACLSGTIVYHAAARGIELAGLECAVSGDVDLRGFLGIDATVRPGFGEIRVEITAKGDFDDDQFAELVSLTSFSPVRDSIANPVSVVVDVTRG